MSMHASVLIRSCCKIVSKLKHANSF